MRRFPVDGALLLFDRVHESFSESGDDFPFSRGNERPPEYFTKK
jgi:hypothetical protein